MFEKCFLISFQQPLSEPLKHNPPYLWLGSKCWMRAYKWAFNTPRRKSQMGRIVLRWFVSSSVRLEYQAFYFICFVKTFCGNISDVRWLPPLQVARSKLVSVVGVNPPSDIASGRIAEMRRRSMSCIAWRASRNKNAEAFLNDENHGLQSKYTDA